MKPPKPIRQPRTGMTLLLLISIILTTNFTINTTNANPTHDVTISDFAFHPQNLTIQPSDTITWTNNDPVIHTLWFVHTENQTTYTLSDPIPPGETWPHTFDEPVKLQYYSFERLWITGFITTCGVEITDVVPSFRGSVVDGGYQTWTLQVNVTVHNNGTQTTDCTVNAYYYNATTPDVLIGTQVVPSLTPCNPVNVTFSWNLASLPECTSYTVKANATCLCTASDEFVDGQVKVRLWGDASGDGIVDGLDKIIVGIALFTVPGDPLWNPYADVSGDGVVDGLDKIIVGIQLFKSCPP